MKSRRVHINKQIVKDIKLLLRYYPSKEITQKELDEYKEIEITRLKHFSHILQPLTKGFVSHADREDLRHSLNKYFEEQLKNYLNQNNIKII